MQRCLVFCALLVFSISVFAEDATDSQQSAQKLDADAVSKRIESWLQSGLVKDAPWNWSDYKTIEASVLNDVLKEIVRSAPDRNPRIRFLIAALQLALNDAAGVEAMENLRTVVAANPPNRIYHDVCYPTIDSLAGTGIVRALPFLTQDAIDSMADQQYGAVETPETKRVFSLVNWSIERRERIKPALIQLKTWLEKHQGDLSWDAVNHRFDSSTGVPGYSFALSVENEFEVKCVDCLRCDRDKDKLLKNLCQVICNGSKAPNIAGLFREVAASEELSVFMMDAVMAAQLAKHNQKLVVDVMADAIAKESPRRNHVVYGLCHQFHNTTDLIERAYAQVAPEYEQAWQVALKSGNTAKAFDAAMALIFCGGKPDTASVAQLVNTMPSLAEGRDCAFDQWLTYTRDAGRPGYLRMLILHAVFDSKWARGSVFEFMRLAHWENAWSENSNMNVRLAECAGWLDENEHRLFYDVATCTYKGGIIPGRTALAEILERIPREYGIRTDDVLSGGKFAARDLYRKLLDLATHNAEAAHDKSVSDALYALTDPEDLDQPDKSIFMTQFPKACPETAAWIYSKLIESDLQKLMNGAGNFCLSSWIMHLKDVDQNVLKIMDAAILMPRFRTAYDEKGLTADVRAKRAMAYLYVSGQISDADLEKIISETNDRLAAILFESWGKAIYAKGYLSGLHLLLVAAKKQANALDTLESNLQLLGMRSKGAAWKLTSEERFQCCQEWFAANEKELVWDTNFRRFMLRKNSASPANGK